jgi:hypothetical protein
MTETKTEIGTHPTEVEFANYLGHLLTGKAAKKIEDHIARCPECLEILVSAYESVETFGKKRRIKKGRGSFMKKINIYLILAVISFLLSFAVPQYFIQLLVATLLLGIKWIMDAKSTKMLVMIYDAWKKGEDKEVSRILRIFDKSAKNRL